MYQNTFLYIDGINKKICCCYLLNTAFCCRLAVVANYFHDLFLSIIFYILCYYIFSADPKRSVTSLELELMRRC